MAANVRSVPVLGFNPTPDPRLQGYDWTSGDLGALEDLLRTPPQEAVVIPLDHQRTRDDLTLQYRLRILDGRPENTHDSFGANNPVWVIFRERSGVLRLLSIMPYVRLHEAYAPHVPPAAENAEWMWWSVRLVGPRVISTHSNRPHPVSTATIDDCRVGDLWRAYPTVQAVLVANWLAKYAVSELRLWEGRNPAQDAALGPALLDRRLDGRESGLIGYWKFNEGSGNRIADSSTFARHGTSKGGQWIPANASGLSLDCLLEDVTPLRHEVAELKRRTENERPKLVAAEQKKNRLDAHIRELQAQKQNSVAELKSKLDALERQIAEENTRHEKWLKDIEYLGTVSLDHFNEEIAREMNTAVEGLKDSAYQLERVGLEVKVLPVHSEQEPGVKDYRVMFPDADAQIDPQQLSTLRFGFEVRPPEPQPGPIKVPDVRGYTELAAQRKLREAGLRMVVMEQATDDPEKIGRVVAQIAEEQIDNQRIVKEILSSDVTVNPNSVVTVFVGHASYSGARGMTAGLYEPGS